ncbi:MAG: NUDIX hydrolase [Verrucomicrobiota bacterium]|nr:NUDIX hydrolase [Verrucomicrobiota bacterium]
MNPERAGWKTISRATHFEDKNLSVATEVVRTPARADPKPWTIVHRKAAVVIAPMTTAGEIILIRQERIPVRSAIWEVPAGQIDDADDSAIHEIEKVALRELREETGYQLAADGELLSLGIYFSSPGFTDEKAHLFLARGVEMSVEGNKHEESESIVDCRAFTPREVARMITNGEIRDANTLAICARLIASGLLSFYG